MSNLFQSNIKRTNMVCLKLTDAELKQLESAASKAGYGTKSDFIREAIGEKIRRGERK